MEPPRTLRRNAALSPLPYAQSSFSSSSSVSSSPSDSSTVSMASSTASLLSMELDDWLPPLPPLSSRKDAAKSPLWPAPTSHDADHDMALVDALLLSDIGGGGGGGSVAWLGDGLHYEPDQEPTAPMPVDTTHSADKTTGGGCGVAGKCGGGAQFADMEALAAAGGCCRGEAGASACCRVAKPSPTDAVEENVASSQPISMLVQVPMMPFQATNMAIPSRDEPSPLACGCSDGNCSSSSSDGNVMLNPKSTEADGGGSSDSTASSSSSSISAKHRRSTNNNKIATSANEADKPAAPRTRKRRSHLTPEERAAVRREQHRETMRRSRQRFRDRVDAMKETVERLETVKANALAALELSASVSESGSIPNDATADGAVLRDQLAFLEREGQQLVREKRELHAQVVQSLLEIVASHPSNFRAITSANRELVSLHNDAAPTGDVNCITSDELTLCDFVTWDVATIGHCLALVRDSYAEISHFYASIAGPGGYPTTGYDAFAHANGSRQHPGSYSSNLFRSGLELMGWRDHRRFRGDGSNDTCLEFAFEKVVPAADARELFVKTWLFCRDQQSFASMFAPAVTALELEVLHEIHDDLVVVRRMQQEEEEAEAEQHSEKKTTKFRSIDLLYRIDAMDEGDDDGWSYVVFRSINPSFVRSCGCAGNAWFDSYMWFGFAPARDGVGGSRVRFGGTLDGHSRAFALRWMLAIFFVLLRWESANVAPLLIVP